MGKKKKGKKKDGCKLTLTKLALTTASVDLLIEVIRLIREILQQ